MFASGFKIYDVRCMMYDLKIEYCD